MKNVPEKKTDMRDAYIAYDGQFLWIGEYKFSGRILRFSGVSQ